MKKDSKSKLVQNFSHELKEEHMNERCKEYGFSADQMESNIILTRKLGEGGEGAAYTIKMKNDSDAESNDYAVKEFNCLNHEGKSKRIMRFLNKVYNEFRMV
jgi:hypothetical protein